MIDVFDLPLISLNYFKQALNNKSWHIVYRDDLDGRIFEMATKYGSIWAQWVGWLGSENASHTHQANPNNRSVTIKSGITLHKAGGGSHWADAGVWRIISNGQLEEFDPPVPNISRNNVTQIVFITRASGCWARASHEITYWN